MTKESSSTPFAAADSTISVEIIVAAGCLHHIVGGSHVALVVFTVSVSVENQNSILSAVVATVAVGVEYVAGAIAALSVPATSEEVAAPGAKVAVEIAVDDVSLIACAVAREGVVDSGAADVVVSIYHLCIYLELSEGILPPTNHR